MSGIALIPDDLLSEILLLIDDRSPEQKFALAQVSQRWRGIALASPLLWSSFHLTTKRDWHHFPTLVERAGSSSMLDVELFADSEYTTPSYAHLEALVPYAPRLRTLTARTMLSEQGLAPLFDGQVDLPVLDTLRVLGPPEQVDLGVASAPALRVLDLTHVFPVNMETLLPPSLEELKLSICGFLHAADVPPIFMSCPRLRRLTFHTFDYDMPHAEDGDPVPSTRLHAPSLCSLDLQLALGDIIDLLGRLEGAVLPEITACIYNGHDEEDMEALCNAMLRGLGALTAFEVQNDQCIVMRDAGCRMRTVRVWNDDSSWDIEAIWRHLSARYSLHTSVQYIQIATTYWDELAEALTEYPIRTAQGVNIRILTDWEDVHSFREGNMREMREVSIPGLDCVELACRDRTGLPPPVVVHILQRLPVLHTRTVKVVVVVDGGVPKPTPPDVWKESISAQVTREGQGRWDLVFMSTELVCT